MEFTDVMPVVQVDDIEAAERWYTSLFGRGPDRRPMQGCVEWQLREGGGVQIYANGDTAGGGDVVFGVPDVDAAVADVVGRGLSTEAYEVSSGQFRLAHLTDPDGNVLTLGQTLT